MTAILVRPHLKTPANRTTAMESQVIPMIQDVFGSTLRLLPRTCRVTEFPAYGDALRHAQIDTRLLDGSLNGEAFLADANSG
jgi:hypothetical protein